MPDAPKIVPLKPNFTPRPIRTTTERGYGNAHQKQRARLLKLHPICQRCEQDWSAHLHHVDRDTQNRQDSNCLMLCEACHKSEHRG